MNENENVQLIKGFFAASSAATGAALSIVAADVDWQSPATRSWPAEITWAAPRHTREQVAKFFQELNEKVQPERMELSTIVAQGESVVVEGCNRGRARGTGRSFEHGWVMLFTIRDGLVVRHRHYYDTAEIVGAFRSSSKE